VSRVEKLEREANQENRRSQAPSASTLRARVRKQMRCERSRGFLVNRQTGQSYPAPCRSWRECGACARSYGAALAARWSRVTGLRAFVVLTMPPAAGDWRSEENLRFMMRSWRRLYERLCRRFGRRPKAMHFKEHAGPVGRLHLNVLWDWDWIDQSELSEIAAACGFGPMCWITRVGRMVDLTQGRPGSSAAVRYSAKQGFRVVAYARKTGGQTAGQGDDWPKRVRRWSASRAASGEMGPRPHNPDWYWSAAQPPADAEAANLVVDINSKLVIQDNRLLPDCYLPVRGP
jgi:hypothetical protein